MVANCEILRAASMESRAFTWVRFRGNLAAFPRNSKALGAGKVKSSG
jgi:hypothetical protein